MVACPVRTATFRVTGKGKAVSSDHGKIGGAEEIRTPDLCIANAALSQLSYGPTAL